VLRRIDRARLSGSAAAIRRPVPDSVGVITLISRRDDLMGANNAWSHPLDRQEFPMKTRMLIATCLSASLACSLAVAQSSPAVPASGMAMHGKMSARSAADMAFLKKASAANLAEVQLGQLALAQATNSDTKAFGQRMVDDHTAANSKLSDIARDQSLVASEAPSAAEQATYAKLKGMQGSAFDHAYDRQAVKDHQNAIKLFQGEAAHGKDPALRDFANQTLPTLKEHLSMAMKLPKG
jgi:putative membrane protein